MGQSWCFFLGVLQIQSLSIERFKGAIEKSWWMNSKSVSVLYSDKNTLVIPILSVRIRLVCCYHCYPTSDSSMCKIWDVFSMCAAFEPCDAALSQKFPLLDISSEATAGFFIARIIGPAADAAGFGCWMLDSCFGTFDTWQQWKGACQPINSSRHQRLSHRICSTPAPNFESCHKLKDDMCEGSPICCRWSIRFWMLTIEDPDALNIIRRAAACWAMLPLSRATQDLNVFGDEARNRFFFSGRVFWDKKNPRLLFAVLYVMAGFATITIGGASTLLVTTAMLEDSCVGHAVLSPT